MDDVVGRCDRKVEKGKLLRISVTLRSSGGVLVLTGVNVFGDFFMHPEEAIEGLEEAILRSGMDLEERQDGVSSYLSEGGIELFGASPADIALAVQGAIEDGFLKARSG